MKHWLFGFFCEACSRAQMRFISFFLLQTRPSKSLAHNLSSPIMDGTDRLSPLPDSLLHRIFSFLNIKSVIQTCVLSKRWKTLWIDTPTLNFDFDDYPFEDPTGDECSKYSSIKSFIFRVFSDHRCQSIQKLSYSSSIHTDEAGLVVELLMCFARHRQVRELCINTFKSLYFNCPLDLLDFNSLTVLKMTCCFVDEWKELCFTRLRILELRLAWWEDEVNAVDLSYFEVDWECPDLESLVLIDCVFRSFHITAPELENFEFSVSLKCELSFPKIELLSPKLKRVKLCNALPIVESDSGFPCVHKVNIAFRSSAFDGDDSATKKLIEDFSQLLKVFHNARSFTLPLKAMEVLLPIPPSVSRFSFHNLRYMKLKAKAIDNMIRLPITTLMSLLKCPNLEMLEVDLNQGVSQLEQFVNVLLEENKQLRQELQKYQEREEDRVKLDRLEAMVQLLWNQREGSQSISQAQDTSQGGPST